MDVMEKLTSVIQPMPRVSGRFSKFKGKDSMVRHLGMFSHGKYERNHEAHLEARLADEIADEWLSQRWRCYVTSIAISVNAEANPHRDVHNLAGSSNYLVLWLP
eukprot:s3448_g7.t1